MRIASLQKLHTQYQLVKLPRQDGSNDVGITVKVYALPLGHSRDYENVVPMPQPPRRTVVNKQTGSKSEPQWDDETYLNLMEEFNDLRSVYMLYLALSPDPEVKFDTAPDDKEALKKMLQEFKDFGITDGDKLRIVKAAMDASGFDKDMLETASKDF